jgi:hypothetical protein
MSIQVETVAVAVTLDNGDLNVLRFITRGRGSVLPAGARWAGPEGWWFRPPLETLIEEEITRSMAGQPVKHVSWVIVPDEAVPTDRSFRAAWKVNGIAIEHDMPKARDIHLNRLRAERADKLAQLDRDWMKATGQGDTQKAVDIERQRQLLRDMPVTLSRSLSDAKTIDHLKAITLTG